MRSTASGPCSSEAFVVSRASTTALLRKSADGQTCPGPGTGRSSPLGRRRPSTTPVVCRGAKPNSTFIVRQATISTDPLSSALAGRLGLRCPLGSKADHQRTTARARRGRPPGLDLAGCRPTHARHLSHWSHMMNPALILCNSADRPIRSWAQAASTRASCAPGNLAGSFADADRRRRGRPPAASRRPRSRPAP